MLLLPSMFFSLTGGGYAHAVSPAYGRAWAAASPPWLLFLLLVTLRLDGEQGDARDAFGRMRWLGVYFPLWVFLLMLIAAHQALPYVWDVDVFLMPPPTPPTPRTSPRDGGVAGDDDGTWKGKVRAWLSSRRLVRKVTEAFAAALAARRENARREFKVAVDAAADGVVGDDDDENDGDVAAAAKLEAGGGSADDALTTAAGDNSGGGGGDPEGTKQQKGEGEGETLGRESERGPLAATPSSPPPAQTDE